MDNMNWQQSAGEPRAVRDSDGVPVAWCGCLPYELAHRRARLIAAAPLLLEALQELLRVNTEAAGLTMSMVANREEFDKFMAACESRVDAAKMKAMTALAKAEGAV